MVQNEGLKGREKNCASTLGGTSSGGFVWREVLVVQRLRAKKVKNKGEKARREAGRLKELSFVSG